ncbi:MAG: DUF1837 domain-containing protein [Methanothrix sp.]|nr:DUF1837 domain-containing protein [Methanothrix sp.]
MTEDELGREDTYERDSNKFFDIIIHEPRSLRGLSGICVGFERGEWRCARLSKHLFEYLPEFALNHSELDKYNSHRDAVPMLRKAAKTVYQTKKFQNRGEFGELILHVVLKELFDTIPAISKIYYKDSANDTVKGFDAVHVVNIDNSLELWLGEVKFYTDIKRAIYDIVKELKIHSETDYLRNEFASISNKIDDSWEYAEKLQKLLHPNTSLDAVFDKTCIPVLLTYDSDVIKDYDTLKYQYRHKIQEEIRKHYQVFLKSDLPKDLKIHLFLLPLKSKTELLEKLQTELEAWQSI